MNFIHALMLIASIILVLMVAVSIVEAQECGEFGYNCDDNSVVTDVANVTSVSNVIGGNENLAIGLSSPRFGAAIGDCMGTTAASYLWGIYGSQKLKESFWCESFNLIRAGYADAGIWILCHRTILKDMPDCPGPLVEMVKVDKESDNLDNKPEIIEIQQQFEIQDTRYSELAARFEASENEKRANARAARQENQRREAIKQEIRDKYNVEN